MTGFKKIKFKKPSNKILLLAISVIIIIAFIIIGITSCSRASYYQLSLDNLSEARFYMKQDETDKLKAQFFTGMREDPYSTNGIAEKTTAFGIINVEPKDKSLESYWELEGTLKVGDELIPVKLDKNPYDKNFACDITRLVDVTKTLSLTLNIGEEVVVFNLQNCMPEESINWEKALEIATDYLENKIKKSGKFECYVKIISDLVKGTGSYWYVQFVTEDSTTFFCVISSSGKVIG